nr:MAG TPA: hypothetical protein [Caudoviricetes sp.]
MNLPFSVTFQQQTNNYLPVNSFSTLTPSA